MIPDAGERGTPALFDDKAASRCVQCGLCLQHCPTYLDTRNEAESPRGRIALMRAMSNGELEADEHLEAHLSSCLTCRACEVVCPAEVPYGELIDGARAWLAVNAPRTWRQRIGHRVGLDGIIAHPRRLRALARLARAWQLSGMRWLARRSRLLALTGTEALESMLPEVPPLERWRTRYPAIGETRGHVGLFLGCVAPLLDPHTTRDAISVLNALGYEVLVPPAQVCCGAVHRHSGAVTTADRLALRNVDAFSGASLEAVVSTASGCGAALVEYDLAPGGEDATGFAASVQDISSFIAAHAGEAPWRRAPPLRLRVAVHEPCTLRNVMRASGDVYQLLESVPGVEAVPLAGNSLCCGSAGINHLLHADTARRLRQPKLEAFHDSNADALVTCNIGCATHFAHAMGNDRAAVLHPVSVVARALTASRTDL